MNGSSVNTLMSRDGKTNYIMFHWLSLVRSSACWMMQIWLLEPHDLLCRDTCQNLMPIWAIHFKMVKGGSFSVCADHRRLVHHQIGQKVP